MCHLFMQEMHERLKDFKKQAIYLDQEPNLNNTFTEHIDSGGRKKKA